MSHATADVKCCFCRQWIRRGWRVFREDCGLSHPKCHHRHVCATARRIVVGFRVEGSVAVTICKPTAPSVQFMRTRVNRISQRSQSNP